MAEINWRDHIHSDPEVLLGKPIVKGIRLSVEFILGLFSEGWTEQEVLDNYSSLTRERLRAVFAFAADCMREESLPITLADDRNTGSCERQDDLIFYR